MEALQDLTKSTKQRLLWLKSPLQPLGVSWAATLMLFTVNAYVGRQIGLGSTGVITFIAVFGSICISLLFTTFGSPSHPGVMVVLLGIPLLAVAAFYTVPEVGQGWQIVSAVAWTMFFALGATAVLASRLARTGLPGRRVARTLLICQAGVVALGLLVLVVGPLPRIQGNMDGIRVQSLRLGANPSQPLVEQERAFVVTTKGLQVIDLVQMKLVATVPLPHPDPGDLGLAGERIEGVRFKAGIRRSGPDKLTISFRWPYSITTSAQPTEPARYVHVPVDTASMAVISWQVNEDDGGALDWRYSFGASVGPYEVQSLRIKRSAYAQVQGAGADVRVRLGFGGSMDSVAHATPVEQGVLLVTYRGTAFLLSLPGLPEGPA